MRWLFLFVLFLNLAYITWEMNEPSTVSYSNIKTIKNAQSIVLLSEVNELQSVEMSKNQADEVSSKQGGYEQDGPVQAGLEQGGIEQVDTEKIDAGKIDIDSSAIETAAIEEAGSEQSGIDQAGSRVMETASLSQQKGLPAQAQQKNDSCYTLGPFRDLEVLRGLTREIKSYVVAVDFRGREIKEQPLYWVYIKPEKSRKKAIATGKRLKDKKIKDYFIIREGKKINGISLGYFKNKHGAYGLVKRVKKLGFNVELEEVFKTYTVYWLDYQVGTDVKIPETIFDKYFDAAKKDKVKRLDHDCGA